MSAKHILKKSATISDVATAAGVTAMTVSRVINRKDYVSEEKRERVLSALAKLNYHPNGLARGLKRQRTDTIGLVLGDIANPYATELARAVRETATARGYNLFICVSENSAKEEVAALAALADHRVDGIIVATRANRLGDKQIAQLIERGTAVALVGRDFHHDAADSVAADNRAGGFMATQHLIDIGNARIGFVGANLHGGARLKRFQGYLDALKANNLPVEERFVTGRHETDDDAPGYSTEKLGYEAMKRLLAVPNRPTAVFARNDFTAVGALTAIKEANLEIPKDIAIVGFDDIPAAVHTHPPLTTVRQPTRKQGQLAAEFLLRRIESSDAPPREEQILECELIVRESTVVR